VGWAIGSVLFGLLADRIGRAKTFLPASCFTRLHLDSVPSPLNVSISPFTVFVGFAIGGECCLGAVLVSECCPKEKKLFALCVINSSFAVGAALTDLQTL
jgi:MFS family permease